MPQSDHIAPFERRNPLWCPWCTDLVARGAATAPFSPVLWRPVRGSRAASERPDGPCSQPSNKWGKDESKTANRRGGHDRRRVADRDRDPGRVGVEPLGSIREAAPSREAQARVLGSSGPAPPLREQATTRAQARRTNDAVGHPSEDHNDRPADDHERGDGAARGSRAADRWDVFVTAARGWVLLDPPAGFAAPF